MTLDTRDQTDLAAAIVETIHEPLVVLDAGLRLVMASTPFYRNFSLRAEDCEKELIYELGNRVFDIPALRDLLEQIVPEKIVMSGFEMEHEFHFGVRNLLLNARMIGNKGAGQSAILLAIEDVTDRRRDEREKRDALELSERLSHQKDLLLGEMRHRVANSLQIIASILLMKARTVGSEESRIHLQDAHSRVMSIAVVQEHLHDAGEGASIPINPYLSKLCDSLGKSIIGDTRPITLSVDIGGGQTTSAKAVSLGLIVTELVINAVKHAFPETYTSGQIRVSYEINDEDWRLQVSDNGIGHVRGQDEHGGSAKSGLGTSLVSALARNLGGDVKIESAKPGTTVSVTHAEFRSSSSLH